MLVAQQARVAATVFVAHQNRAVATISAQSFPQMIPTAEPAVMCAMAVQVTRRRPAKMEFAPAKLLTRWSHAARLVVVLRFFVVGASAVQASPRQDMLAATTKLSICRMTIITAVHVAMPAVRTEPVSMGHARPALAPAKLVTWPLVNAVCRALRMLPVTLCWLAVQTTITQCSQSI